MRKLETTIDLLEAMREEHGLESDGDIARALQVKQQVVSSWRTGIRTPGDEHALKIAEALNTSPLLVIAIAAAERAKTTENRRIWRAVARDIAERVARGMVHTFAAAAVASALIHSPARASTTAPSESECAASVYYDKRRRRVPRAAQPA